MSAVHSVEFDTALRPELQERFAGDAARTLAALFDAFAERRDALIAARRQRQLAFAAGSVPELQKPQTFRQASGEVPPGLADRRVELQVAPVAEALLQAQASPVSTIVVAPQQFFHGDRSALDVHLLLRDMLNSNVTSDAPKAPGMLYAPRLLDSSESLVRWHDAPVSAALLDVWLFLDRAAARSDADNRDPWLHLAGIDSPQEAAFWSDVFTWLDQQGVVNRTELKVTASIDTVNANFALHPILDALSDWVIAVTTDRHAYLRSIIHSFQHLPQFVLPDRGELTPACHFLRAQGLNLVRSAHQHGMYAIAACNATLPPETSEGSRTMQWLRGEIERDARDGFDGCSVVELALVDSVKDAFDRIMPGQQQMHRLRDDIQVTGADLLQVVKGKITEAGLRHNIRLALLGVAAVADPHAASDLQGADATVTSVEFAADQLWQWLWLETGVLDDGRNIDAALLASTVQHEAEHINVLPETLQNSVSRLNAHLGQRELPASFIS